MAETRFSLEFGADVRDERTRFRVWAHLHDRLELELSGSSRRIAMQRDGDGVFEATVEALPAGTAYQYVFADGRKRPDPVSRAQACGVHGPSLTVDPARFHWTDQHFTGRPLHEHVYYELHVGTFTQAGTFDAVIERLPYLRDLGVTALELMPVAEFPGNRNWGYDGVHPYAPHASYGGPEGLRRLVDAAHASGLSVVLDVVYNHLGPEGNYLAEFAPYFTDRYRTPWGTALNFDGPYSDRVRRYFIDNALHFFVEYHIDGLRLDAVHAIYDFGAEHVLAELGTEVRALTTALDKQLFIVAESDLNDSRVIRERSRGGWQMDAQWSDDFHHSLHALVTGRDHGYFADFARIAHLAKAIDEGFVYDGLYCPHRMRRHGNSAADLPGERFVACAQNHDQIGNASGGLRLSRLVGLDRQRLATAILLVCPNQVLLFQGQEYGETAPFHYFTNHGDRSLVDAVREGRKREFASFEEKIGFADPDASSTFEACRLDWSLPAAPSHRGLLELHRDLLALRRDLVSLRGCRRDLTKTHFDEALRWLAVERGAAEGEVSLLIANLSDAPVVPVPYAPAGTYELVLSTDDPKYGGSGTSLPQHVEIGPHDRGELCVGPFAAALYVSRPPSG
jgi:maltooligosyltrehalose trehalohydrolase